MANWKDMKRGMLKDPEVKAEYDRLEPEFALASSLLQARIDKKMTQAELAEQAGISQVMIARLESGTSNPTFSTLRKVADVLGKKIKLVSSH
jgi:DNA-binding XRE family transcriptional regulator